MTPASPITPTPPPASPALSAFLRGIERRAYVFAQVQCGDDAAAEAAVGRAMRAFHGLSAVSPISGWPAGFWSLLLAQAELSAGDSDVPELASLSSGPRAALLLRIIAGLDFPHAAQVLGVAEETYRFALQRALQQLGEAGVSYAALGALRERLHRQVKTLPSERTESLAELRARVLQGQPEPAPPAPPPPSPWRRRLLWLAAGLLALAFAATFWPGGDKTPPGAPETLPAETMPSPPPAAQALGDSDVVTHADYAQLAAPEDEVLAADLALLSWVASGQADPLPAAPAAPARPATAQSVPEADDAP